MSTKANGKQECERRRRQLARRGVFQGLHVPSGQGALLRIKFPGLIHAQFDHFGHKHSHGWHPYPASSFYVGHIQSTVGSPPQSEAGVLRRQYAQARYEENVLSNGVVCGCWLDSVSGIGSVLFQEAHHTDQDLQAAKDELRCKRGVVVVNVVEIPGPFDAAPDGPNP